jgi:hypothetical protein
VRKTSIHTYLYTGGPHAIEVTVMYDSMGHLTYRVEYEAGNGYASSYVSPLVTEELSAFISTALDQVRSFHMSFPSTSGVVTLADEDSVTVAFAEARLNTDYSVILEPSVLGTDYMITSKTLTSFVIDFSGLQTGDFNYLVFN